MSTVHQSAWVCDNGDWPISQRLVVQILPQQYDVSILCSTLANAECWGQYMQPPTLNSHGYYWGYFKGCPLGIFERFWWGTIQISKCMFIVDIALPLLTCFRNCEAFKSWLQPYVMCFTPVPLSLLCYKHI